VLAKSPRNWTRMNWTMYCAGEHAHENGVLWQALQNIDLFHLSRADLAEHLRRYNTSSGNHANENNKLLSPLVHGKNGNPKIKKITLAVVLPASYGILIKSNN
jgi:hypothetical protein